MPLGIVQLRNTPWAIPRDDGGPDVLSIPIYYREWNKGLFALKPLNLSPDKKELTVQFFWQPPYNHKRNTDHVDLLMEPLSSKGLSHLNEEVRLTCFYNDEFSRNIRSGDIFSLTTDDPVIRPLSSVGILEMQWVLQRITAMSGGAGTPDIDLYDDDDMSSDPMFIPDDNDGSVKSSFEHEYVTTCMNGYHPLRRRRVKYRIWLS
jgi:hypothetical protein